MSDGTDKTKVMKCILMDGMRRTTDLYALESALRFELIREVSPGVFQGVYAQMDDDGPNERCGACQMLLPSEILVERGGVMMCGFCDIECGQREALSGDDAVMEFRSLLFMSMMFSFDGGDDERVDYGVLKRMVTNTATISPDMLLDAIFLMMDMHRHWGIKALLPFVKEMFMHEDKKDDGKGSSSSTGLSKMDIICLAYGKALLRMGQFDTFSTYVMWYIQKHPMDVYGMALFSRWLLAETTQLTHYAKQFMERAYINACRQEHAKYLKDLRPMERNMLVRSIEEVLQAPLSPSDMNPDERQEWIQRLKELTDLN